ncbi:MAG: ArsR family transcriptional regulator [Candidatus Magasanikbacteria bacterium]|nr:ArsR family transcriptional regulator [Candidatus Magasanikbacteria bacterium]
MDISIFKKLGFSDKESRVYLALLVLGPSSVRQLAKKTEQNRGSIYEALKWLREMELVSFYEKDTKQYFVAEEPEKLHEVVKRQTQALADVDKKLKEVVSELKSVYDRGGERPVARYYEKGEIRQILEDVLEKCENNDVKEYRVYSDASIREYLYEGFETFSDARVAKGIAVKVIAIGGGGELRGLDERKWLNKKNGTPTYILIYPGSTAYISLNAQGDLVGVVIENDGVCATQQNIFDALWEKL